MILGDLKHWEAEKSYFSPDICKAVDFLKSTDFSKLENGKHEIDGERMFVMINEGATKPKEDLKAESHKSYMDVQYVISGEEKIGLARLTDEQIITDDLMESSDAYLYGHLQDEMELILKAGTFVVFFPADLHRPSCTLEQSTVVRKAVVKILI
ncbi:YhcH/YjgK/YiaL family protein [Paenibacillus eucommiae]|uniref:YhcH/YjgK/YiaL family protein n=1 Tax=Paenibacillus eucommiae TaxID=1355755 RepID=A0ABS4ITB2_9BACL|nr:YhcH/YjgK/YiaL family protein [Paenibacillus eucommiae]MBP1990802.1 YhcH/YjgK/YiaL family protein [Paenibacillus eucommiae]